MIRLRYAAGRVAAGRSEQAVSVTVALRGEVGYATERAAQLCANAGLAVTELRASSRTTTEDVAEAAGRALAARVDVFDVRGSVRALPAAAPAALVVRSADALSDAALTALLRICKETGMQGVPLLVVAVSVADRRLLSRCYRLDEDSCMMWKSCELLVPVEVA